MTLEYAERVRGSLLGGAAGDALGWPIEFATLAEIRSKHGPQGMTGLISHNGKRGQITDDTQMTLFTMEGLIRAKLNDQPIPLSVYHAHRRWLVTQLDTRPPEEVSGRLAGEKWLYSQRAPGAACMSGLLAEWIGSPTQPVNTDSKGCGAVMRSAPFGLITEADPAQAFELAATCAMHTHGHPTACLAAGAMAALVRRLLDEEPFALAVRSVQETLAGYPNHEEVLRALDEAMDRAHSGPPTAVAVEGIGQGWTAEEALAIAVYCALASPDDQREAMLLSVNHSGDSDSTGSICGNLLGVVHGAKAVAGEWLDELEGHDTLKRIAGDFVTVFSGGEVPDSLGDDYPAG